MKKLFALLLAICALSLTGYSQSPIVAPNAPTNFVWSSDPSLNGVVEHLKDVINLNSTNWSVVTYAMNAEGLQNKWGGGIGAYYHLTDYTITGIRLDWVDGGFYMPSFNAGLQMPIKLGKLATLTPFGIAAIGVPLSGAKVLDFTIPGHVRDNSGQATAILGYGLSLNFPSAPKWVPGFVVDRETWSGFKGTQTRVGLSWKF